MNLEYEYTKQQFCSQEPEVGTLAMFSRNRPECKIKRRKMNMRAAMVTSAAAADALAFMRQAPVRR